MRKPAIAGGEPVREQFLVFGSPDIHQEEIDEVVATLKSGWIGTGPRTAEFEKRFRDYVGCRFARAVNSGTAALHVAMLVADIGAGDEVITTPMTFGATANAILHTGATPIFVDCDRETLCIDPRLAAGAVTSRTKAILPVHFGGRPCDMDSIMEIARKRKLLVVEDAAHAIESHYHGKKIGTIGDLSCFSFYVTKNVTTCEGGMVTTDNEGWAESIEAWALHGQSRGAWKRFSDAGFKHYEIVFPGFKYNMTDVQAALGLHQIGRVEKNLKRREEIWGRYDEAFSGLPLKTPTPPEPNTRHARHLYTILLDIEALGVSRDEFATAVHAENVGIGIHYRSLHLHEYYRTKYGYRPEDFPNANYIS